MVITVYVFLLLIILNASILIGTSLTPAICPNATWSKYATTVAGGNGQGAAFNQLNFPDDIFLDIQNTLYVADFSNNRIVKWPQNALTGQVVAGGN
ncbi:unnamed protein product, partial [Didymodactylos carnosus]